MKGHISIVTIVLLAMAGALSLAGQDTQTQQNQKINGYLIDIMCGSKHVSEGASYGAKHTKSCLQMPDCVKSGYAVLTADKKILRFDPKGNELAAKIISSNDKDAGWEIQVTGSLQDDQIAVSSIELTK